MSTPTTRRFARSLNESEPWRGVIEHHKRPLVSRIADVICATALGVIGAALLVHFLAVNT